MKPTKKVTVTSKDRVTIWGYKLDRTENKGHRDLWSHKVRYGDLWWPCDLLGS